MTGRRQFNIDEALESAMRVFWRRGYEGSSIAELTAAMGINAPSLYAAFGSKEGLFHKALDRYAAGPASYIPKALKAPTARAVAEQLLAGAVELYTRRGNPGGCLGVKGALAASDDAEAVRRELAERRIGGEEAVRHRLQRAKSERDLPSNADPAALSRFLWAVIYGMGVESAGGAGRRQLKDVAAIAMRAWPADKPRR